MNNFEYDVIVIGGGTAGLGAYRKAKFLGKKALLIEKNDFVTTCANVGCMPSKLLIAAAENMHEINKSSSFGIDVKDVSINHEKLLSRVRAERDRFVGFVKKGADNIPNEDKVIGFGYIKDKNTIEVNGKIYTTNTIVIATGSSPFIPNIYQPIAHRALTNENIFEIKKLPKSLAVIGAGVIGMELGYAMKNLGVNVTLINTSDKIMGLNKNINDYLVTQLKKELNFIHDNNVIKVEEIFDNNGYKGVHLFFEDGTSKIFENILIAAGRRPVFRNIGLENAYAGNPLEKYNRETMQIDDTNIFFAGDVNNDIPLLHEAAKEGSFAGENAALYPNIKQFKRLVPLSIAFTNPQIMQVGQTKNLPEDIIIGTVSFEDQGRSRVMLKNIGLLNVYFDRNTHKFIGAEMIGPNAENIAHSFAWIIELGVTLEQVLEFPFYHPVVEEGVRTAFRNAAEKIS